MSAMSKNIYYENKFYRDSVVNICRCYCELGARYKEYGKAADVHGNRRKTIVARNALCAFAILTRNDCSFDPSFRPRNIRALILSDTDFNVAALTIFDSFPVTRLVHRSNP